MALLVMVDGSTAVTSVQPPCLLDWIGTGNMCCSDKPMWSKALCLPSVFWSFSGF